MAKNMKGPSRPRGGPAGFSKPGRSTYKKVATQRVQFGGGPRMTPQQGGPSRAGLAAATATNKVMRTGGWRNGKSPTGYEAAAYTYTGNPPANLGSSDIYV